MFQIICVECKATLNTETARASREHAIGVYSFLCGACYNNAKAQANPNY